jgi:hypothetical protein
MLTNLTGRLQIVVNLLQILDKADDAVFNGTTAAVLKKPAKREKGGWAGRP